MGVGMLFDCGLQGFRHVQPVPGSLKHVGMNGILAPAEVIMKVR